MMRKLTLLGMIAAVAIVGLSMAGCDNGDDGHLTVTIHGVQPNRRLYLEVLPGTAGTVFFQFSATSNANGTVTFSAEGDEDTYRLRLRGSRDGQALATTGNNIIFIGRNTTLWVSGGAFHTSNPGN